VTKAGFSDAMAARTVIEFTDGNQTSYTTSWHRSPGDTLAKIALVMATFFTIFIFVFATGYDKQNPIKLNLFAYR